MASSDVISQRGMQERFQVAKEELEKNKKYVNKVCKYLVSSNTKEDNGDRGVVMSNVKTLNEELTLDFVDQNLAWLVSLTS